MCMTTDPENNGDICVLTIFTLHGFEAHSRTSFVVSNFNKITKSLLSIPEFYSCSLMTCSNSSTTCFNFSIITLTFTGCIMHGFFYKT